MRGEQDVIIGYRGYLGSALRDATAAGRPRVLIEDGDPLEIPRGSRVIMAAALADVYACAEDPDRARELNVDLAREVARQCHETGSRLVHVSTWEAEHPDSTVYARTKRDGELAVLEELPTATIVRLGSLYGGPMRATTVWRRWYDAIHRGEPIVINGDPERTRRWLCVRDAATACLAATAPGEIVYALGDESVSLAQMAAIYQSVYPRARIEYGPARPGDVHQGDRGVVTERFRDRVLEMLESWDQDRE